MDLFQGERSEPQPSRMRLDRFPGRTKEIDRRKYQNWEYYLRWWGRRDIGLLYRDAGLTTLFLAILAPSQNRAALPRNRKVPQHGKAVPGKAQTNW